MKFSIGVQALLTFAGAALVATLSNTADGLSYGAGAGTVFLNFIFLSAGWGLIFRKKWVAVAIAIIVIKYAILGALLYYLMQQPWLNLTWFAVGVASFVGTALIYAKRHHGV